MAARRRTPTSRFTNLKGQGTASVGTLLGLPPTFASVPGGETSPSVPVKIENTGDQPLTITNVYGPAHAADAPSASDFTITSQNCTAAGGGGPLAPGNSAAIPPVPRGTCTVNVAFRPTRSDAVSVARLQFTSNSDDATDRVLLAAKSSAGFSQSVGGTVPTVLGLSIPSAASFGAFAPGVTATYNTSMAATVTHTAGSAALTVTDPSPTATGRLVNGAYSLPSRAERACDERGEPEHGVRAAQRDPGLTADPAVLRRPRIG